MADTAFVVVPEVAREEAKQLEDLAAHLYNQLTQCRDVLNEIEQVAIKSKAAKKFKTDFDAFYQKNSRNYKQLIENFAGSLRNVAREAEKLVDDNVALVERNRRL